MIDSFEVFLFELQTGERHATGLCDCEEVAITPVRRHSHSDIGRYFPAFDRQTPSMKRGG
jgi:hypothetical protein